MIAAQQLGVTLGDPSTSEQAKSDHENPLDSGIRLALSARNQTRNRIRVDVTSILIERAVNQAISPARRSCEARQCRIAAMMPVWPFSGTLNEHPAAAGR
jgi:hypothetical protein